MKLKQWLFGVTALSMLAACSDKDIAPDSGVDGNGNVEHVNGYLAVEIKLPEETGSTRGINDDFNDGSPEEYEVDNAMIILFKGNEEKNATFVRAQALYKPFFPTTPEHDQITSSYIAAIEVQSDVQEGDNFWGMVILNFNENSTSITSDEDGNVTAKIAGVEMKKGTTKFSDVLKETTEADFITKNKDGKTRFFMTNAPLSKKQGGAVDPTDNPGIQYLTNLGSNTYDTEYEAKENVSGCIYVERAVSKITYDERGFNNENIKLKFFDKEGNVAELKDLKIDYSLPSGEVVEMSNFKISANVKYALENKNKVSYVVRNVEFDDNHFSWNLSSNFFTNPYYRMVGQTSMSQLKDPFHTTAQPLYRTYWCLDPNYGTSLGEKAEKLTGVTDKDGNLTEFQNLTTALYCKENTFDVAHQNYGNTTLAVFQVDYTITGEYTDKAGAKQTWTIPHLYIRDNNSEQLYLTKESVAANEITRIISDTEIQNALKASMKPNHAGLTANDGFNYKDYLNIEIGREVNTNGETTQNLVIKKISFKAPSNLATNNWFDEKSAAVFQSLIGGTDGKTKYQEYDENRDALTNGDGSPKEVVNTIQYDVITRVNQLTSITEYTNGVSYYVKPIQHFGDNYTPWNTDIVGTTTEEVYNENNANWNTADHAQNYLGRYGLVRNNWYELNISAIKSLGYATIPDIDDDLSDDNNEQKKYFAVEIHILSWAKRTQNVEF